jgi:hypothetical protein
MDSLGELLSALLAGGLLAATATVLASFRELRLKRLIDATTLFMSVTATAHGRRPPSNESVGLGEQVAALYLVGVLGRENKHLRVAAREFLSRYTDDAFGAHTQAGMELNAAADLALRAMTTGPFGRVQRRRD